MTDIKVFRNELEKASALRLWDLGYEMASACFEMPVLLSIAGDSLFDVVIASRVMAIAFEAGRQYGQFEAAEAMANPAVPELG
jgi:hypothetical protein